LLEGQWRGGLVVPPLEPHPHSAEVTGITLPPEL
jgi:hypothetical protein